MFSMNEIRKNSIERRVELVEPLNRAVVVRVADTFSDEPAVIEDVVGDERFFVGDVLLFDWAFTVRIDEPLMGDEIAGIV